MELTRTEQAEYRRRVKKGAALLDEHMPGWANQMNLNEFEMSDGCNCVVGQLARVQGLTMFEYGIKRGQDFEVGGNDLSDYPSEFGFDVDTDHRDYEFLNHLWDLEIRKRKGLS